MAVGMTVVKLAHGAYVFTWASLAAGESGNAAQTFVHTDRCVQFSGTFGGTTMTLQGSLDGLVWFGLRDASGTLISTAAANGFVVLEPTPYIRPVSTGGAGVAVKVQVFGRAILQKN